MEICFLLFFLGQLFCRKYVEIMSDNVVVRWLCHEDIAVNSESILCSSHYKVPLAIHYLNASVD